MKVEVMTGINAQAGADRIELYTEPYANGYHSDRQKAVAPYINAAEFARSLGLGCSFNHYFSGVRKNRHPGCMILYL